MKKQDFPQVIQDNWTFLTEYTGGKLPLITALTMAYLMAYTIFHVMQAPSILETVVPVVIYILLACSEASFAFKVQKLIENQTAMNVPERKKVYMLCRMNPFLMAVFAVNTGFITWVAVDAGTLLLAAIHATSVLFSLVWWWKGKTQFVKKYNKLRSVYNAHVGSSSMSA